MGFLVMGHFVWVPHTNQYFFVRKSNDCMRWACILAIDIGFFQTCSSRHFNVRKCLIANAIFEFFESIPPPPHPTPGPVSRRSVGNFQGWEFVHLLIAHYLLSSNEQLWAICSDRSGQMSDVSESLRLLTKNERCERITGFFEQITHSLIFFGKKRAIRSENRWANSKPWKFLSCFSFCSFFESFDYFSLNFVFSLSFLISFCLTFSSLCSFFFTLLFFCPISFFFVF